MPETARISIISLSYTQLLKYLKADNIFEEELGLAITGRNFSPDVKDMVQTFTLPAMRQSHGHNEMYYTFWLVIDKSTNRIVAELGFKGPPDGKGEVEIGYGTMPGQRCKGFMTEAIGAMMQWAGQQQNIRAVLAEIDEANVASLRVVEKNGFLQFDKKRKYAVVEENTPIKVPDPAAVVQLSGGISVLRLDAGHAAMLRPVAIRAYMEHYAHLWYDGGEWYLEKSFSPARLAQELSHPSAVFFLVYLHQVPVGFMKLNLEAPLQHDADPEGLELERIYLTRAASGQGVGSALMHLAFRIAAENGDHYVWLKAMDSSTGAIAFYKKHGFVPCGTHHLDFPVMKEGYRGMVIMKKTL